MHIKYYANLIVKFYNFCSWKEVNHSEPWNLSYDLNVFLVSNEADLKLALISNRLVDQDSIICTQGQGKDDTSLSLNRCAIQLHCTWYSNAPIYNYSCAKVALNKHCLLR